MIISLTVLEAYFVANYFISTSTQNALQSLVVEMNATAAYVPYFYFLNNAIKQMIFSNTFPLLSESSLNLCPNFVSTSYDVNTVIQKQHSVNIGYHNMMYNNYFDIVMKFSACGEAVLLNSNLTEASCLGFSKGIFTDGVEIAISRHIENIRYVLTVYKV